MIFRRAQIGAVSGGTVLGAIDHLLAVLDAHAHGKGLLLHTHTVVVKHLKGIPGAVADGEDQVPDGKLLLLGVGPVAQGHQAVIQGQQLRKLSTENHLPA